MDKPARGWIKPDGFDLLAEGWAVSRILELGKLQSFAKSDLLTHWMGKYELTRTEARLLFKQIENDIHK